MTDTPTVGTCYVPAARLPDCIARHRTGQAWRYGAPDKRVWTTYCPNRRLSYKSLKRLDVRDESEFWTVMHAAQAANLAPPSSLADLFHSVYRLPFPRVSVLAPFKNFVFGGWQAALRRGEYRGRVWQYDLNSAYRWAACAGLPNLRGAYRTERFDHPSAVYLLRLPAGALPYRRSPGPALVTSEERDAFGLRGVSGIQFLYGVAFRGEPVDLTPTFAELDARFPAVSKKIGRAFWGMWNTRNAPEQVAFKSGTARLMKNPFYNPIYSAIITSRVKLRMLPFLRYALHVYVDSVHLTEPIITPSSDVGGWKLSGEWNGVFIHAPGVWGSGEHYIKRAGHHAVRELGD
jgi:hypothetical protein